MCTDRQVGYLSVLTPNCSGDLYSAYIAGLAFCENSRTCIVATSHCLSPLYYINVACAEYTVGIIIIIILPFDYRLISVFLPGLKGGKVLISEKGTFVRDLSF